MTSLFHFFLRFILLYSLFPFTASAVPPSFTRNLSGNMPDTSWYVLHDSHTNVYFDKNSEETAQFALKSVEKAYPYLSQLTGVYLESDRPQRSLPKNTVLSKFDKIVLILGNRKEGPGFSNPVTNAIEAQLIDPRYSSFFEHELVHRLMYEHFDIHLGAPGRLFSLGMLPTWWIEGLAEYLTESLGHEFTQGLCRNMALENSWLSWEKLHSLYSGNPQVIAKGYATSGVFVRWILENSKEKDLPAILEKISSHTITPPFYNALDKWLFANFHQSGKELYEQFKKEQENSWRKDLKNLPSIKNSQLGEEIFEEQYAHPVAWQDNKAFISNLADEFKVSPSLIKIWDYSAKKRSKLNVPEGGSSVLLPDGKENFITVYNKNYENYTLGSEIHFFNPYHKNLPIKKFLIGTKDKPYFVSEIQIAGENKYFLNASLFGEKFILFLDAKENKLTKIEKFPYPTNIKFIKKEANEIPNSLFVDAIVENENNETSISRFFPHRSKEEIIPSTLLKIKSAYRTRKNKFRLLVAWENSLGIVEIKDGKYNPIAKFPEWAEEIEPIPADENIFGLWVLGKEKYSYNLFDINKLKTNFETWNTQKESSPFLSEFYQSGLNSKPFVKIYQSKFGNPVNKSSNINQTPNAEAESIESYPAHFDRNFIFALPVMYPDTIGGLTVSLISVPLQDIIERDRVLVMAGYNFFLNQPIGTLSYQNQNILDGMSFNIYSIPFFNGHYQTYNGKTWDSSYNYLNNQGISINLKQDFFPSRFKLEHAISISNLKPYSSLSKAPIFVGTQRTTLLTFTERLRLTVLELGLDLAPKNSEKTIDGKFRWDLSFNASKFNGVGNSFDANGNHSSTPDYYTLSAGSTSRFFAMGQLLSLSSQISTTQGKQTLFLQEYYTPYRINPAGSSQNMGQIIAPFISSENLYKINMGSLSAFADLTYEFPLSNKDGLFLMAYVNRWRGILGFYEGGTADFPGSSFQAVSSYSLGTACTLDIKGFQLNPALKYVQTLTSFGWGVIFQLSFMNVL